MEFIVYKASEDDFRKVVTVNTIEDLKKLQEEYKSELIVNFDGWDYKKAKDAATIIIYDDYLE